MRERRERSLHDRPRVDGRSLHERFRRAAPLARTVLPAVGLIAVQQLFFPAGAGVLLQGLVLGVLGAMVTVGLGLIYRANRIINFAQGELGVLPAALAVMLILYSGLPYGLAFGVGLAGAVLVGAIVEIAFIRRFYRASRLILTVATLGVSQILLFGALALPLLWGERARPVRVEPPFDLTFVVDPITFRGNEVIALVVGPLAMLLVFGALRYTNLGIAVRASADSMDRAALLGIPVMGVQTVVWVTAAVLAFLGVFLRAGVIGLPLFYSLTVGTLLRAMAALVLGRMTNLPAAALSAMAIGVLEAAIFWETDQTLLLDPLLLVVIVVGMLFMRRRTRAETDATSSWETTTEVRPYPRELVALPEVRAVRGVLWGVIAVVVLVLPHRLNTEESLRASAVIAVALMVVSIVVLTGWAGQVSLGQMAFVAIGAAVGAKLTVTWQVDFLLALVISGLVGAVIAVLVGLPALRLRGLQLAVVTLAFALAVESYVLDRGRFDWIPRDSDRVDRLPLLGRISWESPTEVYYVCLGVFAVAAFAIRGLRTSRTGRVMIAMRENERAAQAFGVSAFRVKLMAFAISGFIAAAAGCLFVHHQQSLDLGMGSSFASFGGIMLFTSAVIGGLGSITGAVLGAVFQRGGDLYLSGNWRFLVSGIGVLFLLLVSPGGLGGLLFRLRDHWLRGVARRRGIFVPSLVTSDTGGEVLGGAVAPEPAAEPETELEPLS